ncbi:unnamed protein product [Eruca vesicaria subsp. sativa]|uniref:C2H2-type domain-containing protein n=1 Tax=Eruca vesicaria subsp. sativa TaxID=29727 RepID=A0ABC8M4M4_ERUVS|nr:unnamed protein product [Eruca vesicaria subsp. sativa]
MFSRFVQRIQTSKPQITSLNQIKPFTSLNPKPPIRVAVFWDLDNKPPASHPPHDAAVKLRTAASSFGSVKLMVAYANRHAFSHVPAQVREERKERKLLNQLEKTGLSKPAEPYFCGVCDRRFYHNEKLITHFRQIHETENQKRVRQIESARGGQRVRLVAKYAMKMEKYKRAARSVLTPREGYGLAEELKRGGFWVKMVSDEPEAADRALKERMVEAMDRREAECLVLVSDDSGFGEVLWEAKERCLRTVVIGDLSEGKLKRVADVAYSWKEVLMGKAKKEVEKVVGKWRDRDVLKKLEWSYDPVLEKERGYSCGDWDYGFDSDDGEVEDGNEMGDGGNWWEMDEGDGVGSSRPCR